MPTILKQKGDAAESVRGLLRHLLEGGKVESVLTLGKTNKGINYLLISDAARLADAQPLMPFMPENAANIMSQITSKGRLPGRVAAVIKPCELRAFVELVKREQAARENFVLISPICGGVITFEPYAADELEKTLPEYWKAFAKYQNSTDTRPTCNACEHFIPLNADIAILALNDGCEFYLNTPLGEELAADAPGDKRDGKLDEATFKPLADVRAAEKKKLFAELKVEDFGIKGLISTFGRCLGCHGCSSVCPICYCDLCAFECKENEFTPGTFETELKKRGAIRVPPNTIFYQLGRVTHMGISCVGCGMCSDVCPADIPVSSVFLRLGNEVQSLFDYLPGKDFEEPVPLTTFVEEELTEVED